ncbi:MAG: Hsp70 family protein [Calditrichaeota bacterium]|nr:Hsp70 family protein [Calditrichota bacterium]MCB0291869.1 Hsp70 family protein [Calditrichota bacterium]MCB0294107.1 Hsp70 family protein [Calditrichota bacterium]MCB0302676.1 Hsp70 family protein [Calditrichota bacterium]MCB0313425.1 Hsp70 family protein [Calditrichota bacterium]
MHIGIDLGTTFCCVAYIDRAGVAKVLTNSDAGATTPSVIWFDGARAYVGKKANLMKELPGQTNNIFEFVKRYMGHPIELPPGVSPESLDMKEPWSREVAGFKYGAAGMSAIILRKFKLEAVRFFKREGYLDESFDEKTDLLDAVITVPAYFGEQERQDTRLAGVAAGLNVIGIINEPTAAALAYGLNHQEKKRIMVFDLGGGTFDVTILEMEYGKTNVLVTEGANTLGGKDWDELIQTHLFEAFRKKNQREIPDDKGFHVQQKALDAKHDLSRQPEVKVSINLPEGTLETVLYRSAPESQELADQFSMEDDKFYFEQSSTNLVSLCRRICTQAVSKSGLRWSDIDVILLAGGSCRMPMIPNMLEELSGKKIPRHVEGFDYDTAIAIGAALYGRQKGDVQDVIAHSIGVRIMENNRYYVDHFFEKNARLPLRAERVYAADAKATLAVYEGESIRPDECTRRGRVELNNPEGDVKVIMIIDDDGLLQVTAEYPNPDGESPLREALEIKNEAFISDKRIGPLKEKIQSIDYSF